MDHAKHVMLLLRICWTRTSSRYRTAKSHAINSCKFLKAIRQTYLSQRGDIDPHTQLYFSRFAIWNPPWLVKWQRFSVPSFGKTHILERCLRVTSSDRTAFPGWNPETVVIKRNSTPGQRYFLIFIAREGHIKPALWKICADLRAVESNFCLLPMALVHCRRLSQLRTEWWLKSFLTWSRENKTATKSPINFCLSREPNSKQGWTRD